MTPARPVRSVHDLPVHEYVLAGSPSAMLTGPVEPVVQLAERLVRDDACTLAEYAIEDRSVREEMIRRRMNLAMLLRDADAVRERAVELRALQDRLERRTVEGLLEEIVAAGFATDDPDAAVARVARQRLHELTGAHVGAWLKQTRNALAYCAPNVVIGIVRAGLDPAASANALRVDTSGAAQLVAARVQVDCIGPVATALGAALDELLVAHADPEVDLWPARQVTLDRNAPARPVAVGIWDTGVDLDLYPPADGRPVAYDRQGRALDDRPLRPLGDAAPRLSELLELLQGLLDVQANVASPLADAFRRRLASVAPEEAQSFSEAVGLAFQYAHGTIVTHVAVDGNPFARVFVVAMHWPVHADEGRVDTQTMARLAECHATAVRRMQAAGVRVVNMSWGVDPQTFEALLARHGGIDDAVARRRTAAEFLAVERRALEAAIRSAPEILFVAAAGNSSNDASFADVVPSSLSLPNLVTVGAVDRGGHEALFTSTGSTVVLHASGVEVPAVLPGGTPLRISGTSVAAPQVTNAAAKLLAFRPELSGAELRTLLVESGEVSGRVRLLHPRRAFERAGIRLP